MTIPVSKHVCSLSLMDIKVDKGCAPAAMYLHNLSGLDRYHKRIQHCAQRAQGGAMSIPPLDVGKVRFSLVCVWTERWPSKPSGLSRGRAPRASPKSATVYGTQAVYPSLRSCIVITKNDHLMNIKLCNKLSFINYYTSMIIIFISKYNYNICVV